MITRLVSLTSAALLLCWFVLGSVGALKAAAAGESNFQVQLIWGTDAEKPKDKPLKDVDPKLLDKLTAVFKWKNYYEVSRKPMSLPKDGSQKLKMSDKCEIQVQDLGNARVEIRLFGEGVLVVKKVQPIVPGELIILGGNSKNDTAWMVVLNPAK